MKNYLIFISLICLTGTVVIAQTPAQWVRTLDSQFALGMQLSADGESVFIWGNAGDTTCFYPGPAVLKIDTSGATYIDSTYELNFCASENPLAFGVDKNGAGVYIATTNNVITPQDSSYVYYIDNNFTMQWSLYLGQDIRSSIENSGSFYYISSDNNGQAPRHVLRFNNNGVLDTFNNVTLPYLNWAPRYILSTGDNIIEIGNWPNSDTAFMCMRYDTSGNLLNSFAFDANQTDTEVPWFVGVNDNVLFHVSNTSIDDRTYPACSDLSGAVLWIDTLNYQMHNYDGACIDSINDLGFVFCDAPFGRCIFSYDLATGTRLDSILVDSTYMPFSGIKSGPAGGVYLVYRNVNTTDIIVDQYDAQLNLIWRGYTSHPSCAGACNPQDFIIDPLGFVYTVSNCGSCSEPVLVSKFSPSLVSIPENNPEQHLSLFPNPANTEVRIQLSGQGVSNNVNVLNALGEVVYTDKFTGTTCQMSVDRLPSGVYFVQIISEPGSYYAEKLIIQH